MHSTLKKLLPYTVLLVFPAALMVGEWLYARRIHPDGVTNITEHFERLGPPQQIHRIGRRDGIYYYLSGFPDGHPPLLALPSSPPAYIYDHRGHFVTWCSDPGDRCPGWFDTWPTDPKARLDIHTFRKQFAL